ncbi:putative hydroxybutyrate dehydrogenase [Aspergillus karnatakaensis]|uniref:putative hydroxybutyrate dehydrogenase n=1 Tax=Aspergillus karnatakaensis TaxID=1810916 RepID=UPI003CCCE126
MKSVLITGCSNGGLGCALAFAFQKRDFHVFATARSISKMSDLSDLPNITFLALDVTKPDQIAAAVSVVSEKTGGTLDYLINNAGNNRYMPVLDEDLDACRALFEINVWGSLAVTQAFAELVIKARGVIVGVSSVGGHFNTPYMATYAATKRSFEIYLDTLRLELSPFGVRVVSLVTGAVKSNGNSYFEDLALPENSLFKPVEEQVLARAKWEDGVPREEAQKWADRVVKRLTSGASGHLWEGIAAGTMWFMERVVPFWIMDRLVAMGTGLGKLGKKEE